MAISKEKLAHYRELLVEERDNILQDFKEATSEYQDLISQPGDHGDLVDIAYNQYEKDLLIGISDREQETLRKIQAAIQRIDEGKYGYCEVTGEEIEEDRLEAIPYTTLSAKEAMKRSRQRFSEM